LHERVHGGTVASVEHDRVRAGFGRDELQTLGVPASDNQLLATRRQPPGYGRTDAACTTDNYRDRRIFIAHKIGGVEPPARKFFRKNQIAKDIAKNHAAIEINGAELAK
jgi:hypothetical protein